METLSIKLIEVKNCHECPFCNNDNETGYSCNVAEISEYDMTQYGKTDIPLYCPLKNDYILVKQA